MKRSHVALLGACFALWCGPLAALADDVPYLVTVDGRLLDATHPGARVHDGALYINVLRGVRAFDGLLELRRDVMKITVGTRSIDYTIGVAKAEVDGRRVALPAPPYQDGDNIFVPLQSFADLAHAKVTIDQGSHRVDLSVPKDRIAVPAPPPTPGPPDVTPVPAAPPVPAPSSSAT